MATITLVPVMGSRHSAISCPLQRPCMRFRLGECQGTGSNLMRQVCINRWSGPDCTAGSSTFRYACIKGEDKFPKWGDDICQQVEGMKCALVYFTRHCFSSSDVLWLHKRSLIGTKPANGGTNEQFDKV